MKPRLQVITLLLVIGLSVASRAGEIIDVGYLGGYFTFPIAINDNGQILIDADMPNGESHLALYDHGELTDLNEYYGLDINLFLGAGLNNRGDIACTVRIDYQDRAAILSHGEINILPLPVSYYPRVINNRREIVGGFWVPDNLHAFIYSRSGLVRPFGAGGWSAVVGINNRGSVCGSYSEHFGGNEHAFIRGPSGNLTILTADPSEGTAINDRDDVAGIVFNQGNLWSGFLYRSGQLTFFGADAWYTIPSAINNHGAVVGTRYYRDIEEFRAFKYENGILSDIVSPNPEWHLEWATGINNSGEIIGSYTVGDQRRAFLIRP